MSWLNQLLGSYKAMLVPTSWPIGLVDLSALVAAHRSTLKANGRVEKDGQFTGEVTELDWDSFAENVASFISDVNPHWIERHASELYSLDSEILLDDLPLLQHSVHTLENMRISLQLDLGTVLDRRRKEFLNYQGGALALLDLELLAQNFPQSELLRKLKTFGSDETTLEKAASDLIDNYRQLDGNRLSAEWTGYLLRRFSWGKENATLDSIGSDAGVTRERVRQLISRLSVYVGWRRWPMPAAVVEVIKLLGENDFTNVQATIHASPFAADDDWTPEELVKLTEWLGYPHVRSLLENKFDSADELAVLQDNFFQELCKIIRKTRSELGVLDCDSVYLPDGEKIDPKTVKAAASRMYGRYFEAANWALCGVSNSLTPAERKAAQQLSLVSPLEASELYEGIDRYRKFKQASSLPPLQIMLDLLHASRVLEQNGNQVSGLFQVPIDGLNGWLANELLRATDNVLHKDMIFREAVKDHKNVSSINIQFLYNPLIRSIKNPQGLVRLIGSTPSTESMKIAKTVANALSEPSGINCNVMPSSVELNFELGSYAASTGIYQATAELKNLWPNSGADTNCFCNHKTDSTIKFKAGNSLHGMHPLIAHILLAHDGQIGSVINARLQNGILNVLRID